MDAGDWIAVCAGVVALGAAVTSVAQARSASSAAESAKQQARAADEQVTIARQQLDHARAAQREQNEPYVIVDIQPSDPSSGVLVVVIENIGPSVARNVRISADPPLVSGWGDDLTEMLQRALDRTIPMLPPGRRLEYLLDDQQRFKSDLPTAYHFTVQSDGPYGPIETLEYTVDFSTWAESLMGKRPTKQLEDKLDRIDKRLKDLAESYGLANAPGIRDERARRYEAMQERRQAQSRPSDPIPPGNPL
ncbi:hypothetical protein [Kitasatospora sp. NPDC056184]|uniref:hypothetical protein n=1 Tax=Kitasatospora sp. NPDC056184 TaxID=3345738 RepID=UPI0035D9BD11